MTAEGRPWLSTLLADTAPELSLSKATQVGMTECVLAGVIADCEMGRSTVYTLPSQPHRNTFVKNRVDPILSSVPHYKELVEQARATRRSKASADSTTLKEIGEYGAVKFVGANTESEAAEFPADTLVNDEVDLSSQRLIFDVFPQRLHASDDPRTIRLSKPSVNGYGIDACFERSDQRLWFVPCNHCGYWQNMKWEEHVVAKDADGMWGIRDRSWADDESRDVGVVCEKCGRVMERAACLERGEWIAAYPDTRSEHHGYRISRLMTTTPVRRLLTEWNECRGSESKIQEFYNSREGRAYTPEGAALTDALLNACRDDYAMPSGSEGPCSMGVDVGDPFIHVRISEVLKGRVRKALAIRTVGSFEHLGGLIQQYNVRHCVIDLRPESRKAREFQAQFPDIVWLCDFNLGESKQGILIDTKAGYIRVDRTEAFDQATAAINNGMNRLPRNADVVDEGHYYKQMLAPKRVKQTDAHGRERYVWDEGTQADHHRLADVYDDIAAQLVTPAGEHFVVRRTQ